MRSTVLPQQRPTPLPHYELHFFLLRSFEHRKLNVDRVQGSLILIRKLRRFRSPHPTFSVSGRDTPQTFVACVNICIFSSRRELTASVKISVLQKLKSRGQQHTGSSVHLTYPLVSSPLLFFAPPSNTAHFARTLASHPQHVK